MLQIKNIKKKYVTGDLTQMALNDVSFNLRDNEFVAILGQSGSGKTTMLNIIGGLDRYDSGDIIINGISTKKYNDRDWDSYRNHTIGFVFQSYNLIPHQSVLSNVELALTISGISKSERRRRAKEVLEKVGLGDQIHKKPNQMSGGQMQRVAIARALINDPDILLADEPTGALDSETSIYIMELLKEVAKDRLVVMVTHNPELADTYANRIVKLHDGKILDDSNPFEVDEKSITSPEHKNMGKSSMSLLTALSLSFNNLKTKKARTLLTAFAGSIGIIGIALILSLSTGVNQYINDIQKETMTSYPISIDAQAMDLSSIISTGDEAMAADSVHEKDGVYSNSTGLKMASSVTTSIKDNNLTEFKKYLDNPDNEIHEYIGENGIIYSYNVKFNAYAYDPDDTLVNTDGSDFSDTDSSMFGMANMENMSFGGMSSGNFKELLSSSNDSISKAVTDNYDILYGDWPKNYDECILILDKNNEISLSTLYELGLLPSSEYRDILEKINNSEDLDIEPHKFSYEDICNQKFYVVPATDYYIKNENGLFDYIGDDKDAVKNLVKDKSIEVKIVGVASLVEDSSYSPILGGIGYTRDFTNYLIEHANNSEVVKAQLDSPDVNITNGINFEPKDDANKIDDAIEYLSNMGISDKASICKNMLSSAYANDPNALEGLANMGEAELAASLDEYLKNPEDEVILSIYDNYISSGSYDDNMSTFGMISLDAPSSINIYTDSFEDKDAISSCIDDYNNTVDTENKITYTDYVALLMSSITTIINVISYVLIAFVSVSLVVSSIMIGIITYISVLERTKEIGILRAMGSSKGNISQVFNAETFIIGLISGLIGVGITLLLLIPANFVIHALTGTTTINASLPIMGGVILVALSMVLTMVAGLIPSRKAAKKDPVIALRSE